MFSLTVSRLEGFYGLPCTRSEEGRSRAPAAEDFWGIFVRCFVQLTSTYVLVYSTNGLARFTKPKIKETINCMA